MEVLREEVNAKIEKFERLQNRARLCRDLADTAITTAARNVLLDMALDYEGNAAKLMNKDDIARGRGN